MQPQYHVLMIDDDKELCELLTSVLVKEHFKVTAIHDGQAGLDEALNHHYDIIVLDVMLPTKNGFEVLRELQQNTQTPVLMLTARGDEVDRVVGLEIGADDYLAKPCSARELIARLRAILRRVEKSQQKQDDDKPAHITLGQFILDFTKRQVKSGDKEIRLTVTEFDILACLCLELGTVMTKESLYEKALGRPIEAYDRSLDMHISHLRSKLSVDPNSPEIQTVRGVGYMIENRNA